MCRRRQRVGGRRREGGGWREHDDWAAFRDGGGKRERDIRDRRSGVAFAVAVS